MITPDKPSNEVERLSSLYSYHLLDTLPEENIDAITRIASEICGTNISLVTLIDSDRQWFKAVHNMEPGETARELSFCAHAILEPGKTFIVPDSSKDKRFFDNPYVTGSPYVAFYAGVPLVSKDGFALGTLCVLDDKPKQLTPEQESALDALAKQIVALFELRKANTELEQSKKALAEVNEELERFAYVVAHDLKSPCNNIISLSDIVMDSYSDKLDDEGQQMLRYLKDSSFDLKELIDGVLKHAKTVHQVSENRETISFNALAEKVRGLVPVPNNFQLKFEGADSELYVPLSALLQVLMNLANNAVKYNDKQDGVARISFEEQEFQYVFKVADNGRGIPEFSFNDIFGLFRTLGTKDQFNNKGYGIGLSTVKKLVERMGGEIVVSSEVGVGTTFTFSIAK